MRFSICFVPSAHKDLIFYPVARQRIIADSIKRHLTYDANLETRRRKKLIDHPVGPWELRIGDIRVFYDIENDTDAKITAIGRKVHNEI
jgi:mRNA-degrading endonuclease RelE of RelBE toxin-antitoxin system